MTKPLPWLRLGLRRRTKNAAPTVPSLRLTAVPSPVRTLYAVQWSLVGITLLSVGLTGWWWQESQDLGVMAERYDTAAARTEMLNRQFDVQLAREGLTLPGDEIAIVQGKIAFANQLAGKRAFSWTRLLSELEETVPEHVSIASVKLDFQQSNIVIDGLARNLQDVNAFVQTLQGHQAFQKALLSKHEMREGRDGGAVTVPIEGASGNPHHGIEFTLAVSYRAAGMHGELVE